MKKTIITVVGHDTVGIIAKVCTYLAENNINILDISQTIVQEYISLGGTNFTIEPHLIAFKGIKFLERIGEKRQISYKYSDSNTAFDVACNSFRDLL